MQAGLWSTEILALIVVVAVIAAVIGFFVGKLMQRGKAVELSTLLEQSQQALLKREADFSALQSKHAEAQSQVHAQQLTQSKLEEQLNAARATESRLANELGERKSDLVDLNNRLEEANQRAHANEKNYETAQTKISSLNAQELELRERLQAAEQLLNNAQSEVNRLKDELSAEGKTSKSLATAEREVREQLSDAKRALNEKVDAYQKLQQQLQSLSNEHTQLKTTLEKREEHFKEQMAQLSETKKSLTQEFENLANKIFEEKGKTFTQTSQTSIDGMLKPFREQIEGFQKRVNEIHDASNKGTSDLGAEIKKVLEIGLKMNEEASNLASALKGDSQQRGAWGEAQLQQTLEMSGLVKDYHYETQTPFKDADGNSKKTDYLIKLPDNKRIIIDSKVSLVAYDRAIAAQSPEEYQLAMAEHIKAVRKHIDDLASKDYTNLIGMRSPSFVLMFMAIEPAYIEALKNNKDLFEYGYKKGIVLVSHTTLIPILRTVSNL
ncbi:MAG TPA: DNA recombination protein RmuC, partial [Spongiibacteraceae bacterium]|nr:DNA recombination protein RmuC [Spongiibacteraceae bacterium]